MEPQPLCCSVNPDIKCRDCNIGVCGVHRLRGRDYQDYFWCHECATVKEDYIDLIGTYSEKLNDAIGEFNSAIDEWDSVAAHVARCRNCRGEETPCQDLYALIDSAASNADACSRRVRKLNQ